MLQPSPIRVPGKRVTEMPNLGVAPNPHVGIDERRVVDKIIVGRRLDGTKWNRDIAFERVLTRVQNPQHA